MKKTIKPTAPKTIEDYKKALTRAKQEATMLRRKLKDVQSDVAMLERLLDDKVDRIMKLENRSWIQNLFNLKG